MCDAADDAALEGEGEEVVATTAPIPALLVLSALDGLGGALLDSCRALGPPGRLWGRGLLPRVLPAMASGAAISFCLALGEHAVPALLSVPVYATEVYAEMAATGELAPPGVALVLPGLLALVLAQWVDRDRTLLGHAGRWWPHPWDSRSRWGCWPPQ